MKSTCRLFLKVSFSFFFMETFFFSKSSGWKTNDGKDGVWQEISSSLTLNKLGFLLFLYSYWKKLFQSSSICDVKESSFPPNFYLGIIQRAASETGLSDLCTIIPPVVFMFLLFKINFLTNLEDNFSTYNNSVLARPLSRWMASRR